jgi:uncharacterized repeat protein (TIGR03803 family)
MERETEQRRWLRRITQLGAKAMATCWLALGAMTGLPLQAQSYKVLYSFSPASAGSYPSGHVIRDAHGNFYGTTAEGGKTNTGVVFKVNSAGKETLLQGLGGIAGAWPASGVIEDAAGNLYGTATQGGAYNFGLVFKVSATGEETALYNFTGGADGGIPVAQLIQDAAGNFYSTTQYGGSSGAGVVYKLDPTGAETVLYSFTGGADGAYPFAPVIRDTQGRLYGTTPSGGTYGSGVVFSVDEQDVETVVYTFTGGNDGGQPNGGLIQDAEGNLYGVTSVGGAYGAGVVFKLDPSGNETVLYAFTGGADGGSPDGPLLRDAAGNLYGTTYEGGVPACDWASGCGTVFRMTATGKEAVIYAFPGAGSGTSPLGGLIQDALGNIYGTAEDKGPHNANGVIFEISRN